MKNDSIHNSERMQRIMRNMVWLFPAVSEKQNFNVVLSRENGEKEVHNAIKASQSKYPAIYEAHNVDA